MPQQRSKKLNMEKIEIDTKNPNVVTNDKQNRADARKRKKRLRIIRNIFIVLVIILILGAFGTYLYFKSVNAFEIENVQINGVEHLTSDEMNQLMDISDGATLLNIDSETIIKRLKKDAWIKDVQIIPSFPSTLIVNVTERPITAIAEVPSQNGDKTIREWAISSDHMWLMPVPAKNTETAKKINQQIYNDVEGVMHIVEINPSVQPEIGSYCTDDPVNCAIDVVAAMTTDLKNQVKNIKATDANSANLYLKNGVEIAVGTSENLRDKERVAQELMSRFEGKISYINVRNPQNPTWRSI